MVRRRRVDLRDELKRRFGVELHERSVGRILDELGYRRLSVRPRHREADEDGLEALPPAMMEIRALRVLIKLPASNAVF